MAVLLHFFFLSAFAWMLVEGLHLYSMVVKVFGSEGSKHFYYYGIGWGRSAHKSLLLQHYFTSVTYWITTYLAFSNRAKIHFHCSTLFLCHFLICYPAYTMSTDLMVPNFIQSLTSNSLFLKIRLIFLTL